MPAFPLRLSICVDNDHYVIGCQKQLPVIRPTVCFSRDKLAGWTTVLTDRRALGRATVYEVEEPSPSSSSSPSQRSDRLSSEEMPSSCDNV
ncbi:hypothetical protein N7497_010790 [Penicillium chrysogenum]|nr:hypothetical protein N7497_010790 [Penicillium chrysogenum]